MIPNCWSVILHHVTNKKSVYKSLYEQLVCSFPVVLNRRVSSADRHRLIAQAVKESGSAMVPELAALTGASEMTVRRDLDTLAAQGVLERFHGGARTLLLRGEEPPFALRAHEALDAKRRIAAEVCRLIADGETVLLDSGTTCLEVARLLHGRQVTVMPLSLQAIHTLSDAPAPTTLMVPGGRPRNGEGALTGPSLSPPSQRCASTPRSSAAAA